MLMRSVRTLLPVGVVLAALSAPARGGDCGGCGESGNPCGPVFKTVAVTEWVPENYETTRTVLKTVCATETYTAYRTECVPETRQRVVTVNKVVPVVTQRVCTEYTCVPTVETRTVMKRVEVCTPVTTVRRKCVDMGHYECREVPCGDGVMGRLRKCFGHKKDDCCQPAPTKTVKVWVPNKVWIETPVTKMVRSCQYVPSTVQVTVNRQVPVQKTYPVTTYQCVPEQTTQSYTVLVPHQVPYQATRTVARTVPVQERVVLCRMVPRTVEKQVPSEDCDGQSASISAEHAAPVSAGHAAPISTGHRHHRGGCRGCGR